MGGGGHAAELWPRKDITIFYFSPTDERTGVCVCVCEQTVRMNGRHAAILSVLVYI